MSLTRACLRPKIKTLKLVDPMNARLPRYFKKNGDAMPVGEAQKLPEKAVLNVIVAGVWNETGIILRVTSAHPDELGTSSVLPC